MDIQRVFRLAFVATLSLLACSRESPAPPLVVATTTSVVNSGFTDRVLPAYERQTGVRVRVIPVGSGLALKLLRNGQADAAITHAPAQETAALAAHPDWRYRKILYNDFVILGPPEDSAGVAHAKNAVDAMRRIAESHARFISRGDESGTHERERQLWEAAGARPAGPRLVIAGAGMGDTLRIASETASYTLSDRATFDQLAPRLALQVLNSGDPALLNTYAVVADVSNPGGMQFARWLSGDAGRKAIADLLANGQIRGFSLWPVDRPGESPADRPK
jgi:tungstate transport system substrate-binding protein